MEMEREMEKQLAVALSQHGTARPVDARTGTAETGDNHTPKVLAPVRANPLLSAEKYMATICC